METKKIESLIRRIKAAKKAFGCMGEMLLRLEIDAMSADERKALKDAMLSKKVPLSYEYLDIKDVA